jgi:hypothetical protein
MVAHLNDAIQPFQLVLDQLPVDHPDRFIHQGKSRDLDKVISKRRSAGARLLLGTKFVIS